MSEPEPKILEIIYGYPKLSSLKVPACWASKAVSDGAVRSEGGQASLDVRAWVSRMSCRVFVLPHLILLFTGTASFLGSLNFDRRRSSPSRTQRRFYETR